jgi:glycosyltransferase involved in cell wall biosynthesis
MSIDCSVIITNYNRKEYLGRAIRSCLKQSLSKDRYEIIVVDDCSTDESRDVIVGFKDKIVPIMLDQNVGVAEASNIGIKSALGRFVIRVDSDDYINENLLLFMTEILNDNKDIGFVYGNHLRVDENETTIGRVDINTLDLLFRHGAGIMFRKSYLEAIGLYDKELRNAEDFDLLKRYIKNFNGYHLKFAGYRYRIHDGNMTRDEAERKKWENKSNEKHEKGISERE